LCGFINQMSIFRNLSIEKRTGNSSPTRFVAL